MASVKPDVMATKVAEVLKNIQEQARESRQSASVLGSTEDLDSREARRLLAHPLPHWVERMTVSRIMPLFLADDGRVFTPTARHIWDKLLTTPPTILTSLGIETSHQAFERLREAAERQGKTIYDELVQAHRERLALEREKGEYAFAARRRATERIGLSQIRNHRRSLLEQEDERFREQLERSAQILPEMQPVLVLRAEGSDKGLGRDRKCNS